VAGINSDGETGIDDNGSRVGLSFLADITETIEAVGRPSSA